MSSAYKKPEHVLKKAEDLIQLDKRDFAVDVLLDLLKGRRNRGWQQVLESAAGKLLEICVILNNGSIAKEALYQYKNSCQNGNFSSFEEVVRNFLVQAQNAVEKIRSTAKDQSLVDDLDQSETPETILLKSTVVGYQKDRSEAVSFNSALKFCWESFRNTMEITKNNKHLEKVYVESGLAAMKFCLKYSRRSEFRKLCDMTRSHLQIIFRGYNTAYGIDLTESGSLQLQISLRLTQLDVAISNELWLEAYKTMEEIYELIRMSRKLPKPSMLAHFYQQTALVFFRGDSHLFHAILVHKLYILVREQKKNISREELTQISNKALMASASIPHTYDFKDYESDLEYVEQIENITKLTSFLKLTSFPTRKSVIAEMIQLSVLKYADQRLVDLYEVLEESSSDALHICRNTHNILCSLPEEMKSELSMYFPAIHDVAFRCMISRLSNVYSRITMNKLLVLTPFYADKNTLYKKLVDAGRAKLITISIDDTSESVILQNTAGCKNVVQNNQAPSISLQSSNLSALSLLSTTIPVVNLCRHICDSSKTTSSTDMMDVGKKNYIKYFKEHNLLQKRVLDIKAHHDKIVECTNSINQKRNEREKDQQMKAEQKQQQILNQELARQEEEKQKREERKMMEQHEAEKQKNMLQAESLRKEAASNTALKKILTAESTTVEEVVQDPAKLKSVQEELKRKEIDKKIAALKAIEKKADHHIRAIRMAERPKYASLQPQLIKTHKEYCSKTEIERVTALKKQLSEEEDTINRLKVFAPHIQDYIEHAAVICDDYYKVQMKEFEESISKSTF